MLNLNNLNNKGLSFGKFVIDLRHYQKISRSIVWANRASYGQFFGPRPQVFRIGGMDNWLNANYARQPLPGQLHGPRPGAATSSL